MPCGTPWNAVFSWWPSSSPLSVLQLARPVLPLRLPQAARLVHRERRLARRRMQARRVEPWHVRVLRIHELLRSSCALSERRGAADQHGHVPECTHQLHAVPRGHPLVPRSRLRPRPHVGRPTLGAGDGFVRLRTVTYGYVLPACRSAYSRGRRRLCTVTGGYVRSRTVTYGHLRPRCLRSRATYDHLRGHTPRAVKCGGMLLQTCTIVYGYIRLHTVAYGRNTVARGCSSLSE